MTHAEITAAVRASELLPEKRSDLHNVYPKRQSCGLEASAARGFSESTHAPGASPQPRASHLSRKEPVELT